MKKIISILLIVLCLFLSACKKDKSYKMTVIKDCTGTYLRFENKDYHVCNLDKISVFENNTEVEARFKKIDDCDFKSDVPRCAMVHNNDAGWVEVEEIK